MRVITQLILGLMILVLWSGPASAEGSFAATVTQVLDGDSIMVRQMDTGRLIAIRLYGIDCPEGRQPWGNLARSKTIKLCLWYRKYAPGERLYERSEVVARMKKRGLWSDPNPVPPWEWRRRAQPAN